MAKEVFMPKSGMDMQEGRIIRWLVKEGDRVREGDVLLEIETDKVAMEVEAPCDGILLRRFFDDGAVVPVVTIIAYIGEEGEEVPDKPSMAGGRERAEEAAFLTKGAPQPKREYEYQLAIIGGGPAGYTAALRAEARRFLPNPAALTKTRDPAPAPRQNRPSGRSFPVC